MIWIKKRVLGRVGNRNYGIWFLILVSYKLLGVLPSGGFIHTSLILQRLPRESDISKKSRVSTRKFRSHLYP